MYIDCIAEDDDVTDGYSDCEDMKKHLDCFADNNDMMAPFE
jgi:hypothetical protein